MALYQYEIEIKFKNTIYKILAASIPLDLNRACHSKEENLMPPRHRNGSNFLAFRFHTQKAYIPIIPRYTLKNISAELLINNHVGSWMCWRQRYTKPVPPKFSEVNVSNVKYDLNQMRVYEGPWCWSEFAVLTFLNCRHVSCSGAECIEIMNGTSFNAAIVRSTTFSASSAILSLLAHTGWDFMVSTQRLGLLA